VVYYFAFHIHTFFKAIAVGRSVTRSNPARIPACGFPAPGSSRRLASAFQP
jgi:hypothetical protein